MSFVKCKVGVVCARCGREIGEDCMRRVEHRHRVYDLFEGLVCGSCWVVNHHAPSVATFVARQPT